MENHVTVPHENGTTLGAPPTKVEEEKKPEVTTKVCDYCQETVPFKATRCKHCHAALAKTTREENEIFSVVREETSATHKGMSEKVNQTYIVPHDNQLKSMLRNYLSSNKTLYDKDPKVNTDELFTILPNLRQILPNYQGDTMHLTLKALVDFIEKEYEVQSKRFESMRKEGLATFEALQFLFTRGIKVFGYDQSHRVGTEVTDTNYTNTMFGMMFTVNGEVVKSNGENFYIQNHQFVIPQFRGMKKITELEVQPLDDETLNELKERGRKFNRLGVGAHYQNYVGNMIYKTRFYTTKWKANGRIMIDGVSFNKMNPTYSEFNPNIHQRHRSNNDQNIKVLPEDTWYKTWPTIGGFSFTVKKWGEIAMEDVGEIKFDDNAYKRLVLEPEKKLLIQSLVVHTENAFADIISGKGAGCIFLLHGKPGCGKTLTAEAIAELLHRPLYSVTVGELGTSTDTLETKLRDILDVAGVWNAVILIDEADIFLEKRQENDIERNAMVGVFLRLLEYHQGILFLTTNRVRSFDDAFHSRISVALKYDDLDMKARRQVWNNFFEIAEIDGINLESVSKEQLNGRQIRNTIRLAQALAKSENTSVTMSHINRTVDISAQFQRFLDSREEEQSKVQSSVVKAPAPPPIIVENKTDNTMLFALVPLAAMIGFGLSKLMK